MTVMAMVASGAQSLASFLSLNLGDDSVRKLPLAKETRLTIVTIVTRSTNCYEVVLLTFIRFHFAPFLSVPRRLLALRGSNGAPLASRLCERSGFHPSPVRT